MSKDEKTLLNEYIKIHLAMVSNYIYKQYSERRFKEDDFKSIYQLLIHVEDAVREFYKIKELIPSYKISIEDEIKKMINIVDKEPQTFMVKSGKIRVTDPCYGIDTWCAGNLENVKNGVYHTFIKTENEGAWGIRVAELLAIHENYTYRSIFDWDKSNIDVGVDSGQAGFFDYDFFANLTGKESNGSIRGGSTHDIFYDEICDKTLGRRQFGTVEYGVASSSGFGDGSYDCYYAKEGDEIIAMKIVYISDEEEEEEEE